jgi:hypothetical protein
MKTEMLQFGGLVAVRSLSIVTTLVVARYAPASALGDFLQLQLLGLLSLVFLFARYERAIIDERTLRGAVRATRLCAAIGLSLVLPLALFIAFMVPGSRPTVHPFVFFVLLTGLLAKGLQLLAYQWFQRAGLLRELGVALLAQVVAQAIFQLYFLYALKSPLAALVAGECIGLVTFCAVILGRAYPVLKMVMRRIKSPQLRRFMFRHIDLPTRNLPGAILSQAVLALPLVVFAMKSSPDMTGYFGLALRLSEALFQVIAGSLTALWVSRKIWIAPAATLGRWSAAYLLLLSAAVCGYLMFAWIAMHWTNVPNWVGAAQWAVLAVLWSSAIGASGPIVDIVGYQKGDRAALWLHGCILFLGFTIAVAINEPVAFLWAMAALGWLRAIMFFGLFLRLRALAKA